VGANRPGGETSRVRNVFGAKHPGGELTKGRNIHKSCNVRQCGDGFKNRRTNFPGRAWTTRGVANLAKSGHNHGSTKLSAPSPSLASAVFRDLVAPPQDLSCGPLPSPTCFPSYPSPPPPPCWLRSGKIFWAFYLRS